MEPATADSTDLTTDLQDLATHGVAASEAPRNGRGRSDRRDLRTDLTKPGLSDVTRSRTARPAITCDHA